MLLGLYFLYFTSIMSDIYGYATGPIVIVAAGSLATFSAGVLMLALETKDLSRFPRGKLVLSLTVGGLVVSFGGWLLMVFNLMP